MIRPNIKTILTLAILLLSNAANARYHYHGHHGGYSGDLKASHVYWYAGAVIGICLLVELLKYLDRRSKKIRK